jgi:hypothetical protein
MRYDATTEIGRTPVTVWGYNKKGRFVCRIQLNSAGIEVKAGRFGNRNIADVTWEKLIERLAPK